jgi:threonine dehydrogenase-like Zn-dependent dehydrogenase
MSTMPALVNYAREPLSVELRDVKIPDIGETDVLLRVGAVSICGSDLTVARIAELAGELSVHSWA